MERLRDPDLPYRRELEAARAWGVPRSVFLGRVVAAGEPLWLAEDRYWALALLEAESGICGDCGQPLAESTHVDNEFAYDAEPAKCHGCAAAARRVRVLTDGGNTPDGLKVSVYKRK